MRYQLLMNDGNTLIHYGVLGMKWGVRHDREKAAYKSLSKLKKLDKKYTKAQSKIPAARKKAYKSARYEFKATKALAKGNVSKYQKYHTKALKKNKVVAKAEYRAAKSKGKVDKWARRMIKEFGNKPLKYIDTEQKELGRRYMIQAIEKSRTNPKNWKQATS